MATKATGSKKNMVDEITPKKGSKSVTSKKKYYKKYLDFYMYSQSDIQYFNYNNSYYNLHIIIFKIIFIIYSTFH